MCGDAAARNAVNRPQKKSTGFSVSGFGIVAFFFVCVVCVGGGVCEKKKKIMMRDPVDDTAYGVRDLLHCCDKKKKTKCPPRIKNQSPGWISYPESRPCTDLAKHRLSFIFAWTD